MSGAAPGPRLEVRRFLESDRAGIERLNQRLAAGGVPDLVYPEEAEAVPASGSGEGAGIRQRLFVVGDGQEIRGGVWLKEQDFWVRDRIERMGWAKYPVAESLISADFAGVPGALLMQLLREQPRLLALGMGGHEGPFARFLARMRWQGQTIPLFVHPCHPSRVLRQLGAMGGSPVRRTLARVVAATHGAEFAVWARTWWAHRRSAVTEGATEAEVVDQLGAAADQVWQRVRGRYGFLAARDATTLAEAYPSSSRGVTRLLVRRSGSLLGWLVVFRHDPATDPTPSPFGPLSHGVLADGLAAPEDAPDLLAAGHRFLRGLGVDLIVSNQGHPLWQHGLRALGYFEGPARFAFYQAPAVTTLLASILPHDWHVTRGDCHGGDWQ